MNTFEIVNIIEQDLILNKVFAGVFSRDKLPEKIETKPAALIVNTDLSHEPGQHWVAMYFDSNKGVDYFDSYGLMPIRDEFNIVMRDNANNINSNSKWLQGINTSVCGMYCIFFLHHRSRGINMKSIIKLFDLDQTLNDARICRFFSHVYNIEHNVCCNDKKLQICVPYCRNRYI